MCVCVSVHVCVHRRRDWVCVHTVHSPLRGQERLHWNFKATATTLCAPPWPPNSPTLRLAARPTSSRHTTGFAPHPRAFGRSMRLFSFHLTRAGEESYFLKKTQYSTQHSLSGYHVSLYLLYNIKKNIYFTSKVGTFFGSMAILASPHSKDFLRVKTWV